MCQNKNSATQGCLILQVIFHSYFFHFITKTLILPNPFYLIKQYIMYSNISFLLINLPTTSWYVVREIFIPTPSSSHSSTSLSRFQLPNSFHNQVPQLYLQPIFPIHGSTLLLVRTTQLLLPQCPELPFLVSLLRFFLLCNAFLEGPIKKKSYSVFKTSSITCLP